MDLIVCAREQSEPGLSYGTTVNGKGSDDSGAVAVKGIERSTGNESMFKLVKHICGVHWINLEAVRFVNTDTHGTRQEGAVSQDTGSDDLPEDPFGWPELQIGIIREALSVAEALPGT
jgi:hypothetical protein